jgi:hypothetical protein
MNMFVARKSAGIKRLGLEMDVEPDPVKVGRELVLQLYKNLSAVK